MARVFCDLYCIEDAVKKGDKSILDSVGNLYEKIKETTKDMFDFYIEQVLAKMGQLEAKLYIRFDGISEEIHGLSGTLDQRVDVKTSDLEKKIQEVKDGLNLVDVTTGTVAKNVSHAEVRGLQGHLDYFVGNASALSAELRSQAELGEVAGTGIMELRNLQTHLVQRLARAKARSALGLPALAEAAGEAEALAARAAQAHERGRWRAGRVPLSARAAGRSSEFLGLSRASLEASRLHSHRVHHELRLAGERRERIRHLAGRSTAGEGMAVLRRGQALLLAELRAGELQQMLLEFDKQWVGLVRGVESFLDSSERYHGAAREAADTATSYMQCDSVEVDYPALLARYRTMQEQRRGAEASLRTSYAELQQRLTLLANILVDGGLIRMQIAATAAGIPHSTMTAAVAGVGAAGSTGGEARTIFTPSTMAMLQDVLAGQLFEGLPSQLMGQARAALVLATHLEQRHQSAGLRTDSMATAALRSAWSAVLAEFGAHEAQLREPSADPTAFAQRLLAAALEDVLPSVAPPPEGCGEGPSSVLFGRLPAVEPLRTERFLVLSAPSALLGMRSKSTWRLPLAGLEAAQLRPRICEPTTGGQWLARAVTEADGLVLCGFGSPREENCTFQVDTWTANHRRLNVSFLVA